MRALFFVLLRSAIILVLAASCATLAVLLSQPFRRGSGWNDGLSALLIAGSVGGLVGTPLGMALAWRLGRRRYDAISRSLQTLAALGLPFLFWIGILLES